MTSSRYTWVTVAEAVRRTTYSNKAIRSRIERGTVLYRKGLGGRILVALESLIASPDEGGPNGELHDDAGGRPLAENDLKGDTPASRLVDRPTREPGNVSVRMIYEIDGPVDAVVATCKALQDRREDQ